MTTIALDLRVAAIDSIHLDRLWTNGRDERGNRLQPFSAEGWEPVRCCLTMPRGGELIALIAYTPFDSTSPWAETGPVYVHAEPCSGYSTTEKLPSVMRTGPKVLRSYRADGSLDYDQIVVVPDGVDIERSLLQLLAAPDVTCVHVRAHASQCFAYSVSAAPPRFS